LARKPHDWQRSPRDVVYSTIVQINKRIRQIRGHNRVMRTSERHPFNSTNIRLLPMAHYIYCTTVADIF